MKEYECILELLGQCVILVKRFPDVRRAREWCRDNGYTIIDIYEKPKKRYL